MGSSLRSCLGGDARGGCVVVFGLPVGVKAMIYGLRASFAAEACSTTEDGDEPLHCPTGYECHIINPGNTAEGIPNRGQCIKLRGNPGQLTGDLPSFLVLSCKHQEGRCILTVFEGDLVVHLLPVASWVFWAAQGPGGV